MNVSDQSLPITHMVYDASPHPAPLSWHVEYSGKRILCLYCKCGQLIDQTGTHHIIMGTGEVMGEPIKHRSPGCGWESWLWLDEWIPNGVNDGKDETSD